MSVSASAAIATSGACGRESMVRTGIGSMKFFSSAASQAGS